MMTNEEAEKFVLENLPNSYGSLVRKVPHDVLCDEFDRVIDKALQRLRKRGQIDFVRSGRTAIWSRVDDAARSEAARGKGE